MLQIELTFILYCTKARRVNHGCYIGSIAFDNSSQRPEGSPDHDEGRDRNKKIGDGARIKDAVDAHKAGQDEQQNDQDQLLGQGYNDSFFGLFDRDHRVHGDRKDARQDDQQHELVHVAHGKSLIAAGAASEQGEDLMREEPETKRLHRTDEKGVAKHQEGSLFDAVIFAGAEVEAHDGLAAYTAADDRGIEEEVDLGDDARSCKRFAPAIRRERAVVAQRAVENKVHDKHGGLVETAGCADGDDLCDFLTSYGKVRPFQFPCFEG